jgi:phage terminase small subunit
VIAMAGRPSKPVQLIKLEGNKDRRTKAELEYREKMEKSLYTGINFKESPAVKADPIAHKEFLRLKKLYKHIQYVDGLDEQIINRYCMLISQEQALAKMMERMRMDIDEVEDVQERIRIYESIAGVTDKVMKTRDMLLKLEDRLFLNPTARIKAIPKKPPEEKKESAMAEFLKRRGANATS